MKQRLKAFFMYIVTFVVAHVSWAQVTTLPATPSADEEITIIYDATQGTSALQGATKVYMHAGVVLQGPTSNAWENVVGNWGKDDGLGAMTSMGNNKWSIKINPRTYFNVPSGKLIYRIGMVFRSADGTKEGKGAGNSDIFVNLSAPNFYLKVTPPSVTFYNPGEKFTITAETPKTADFTVLVNNVLLTQKSGTTLSQEITAGATLGVQTVKITAKSGTEEFSETFIFNVIAPALVQALPAGVMDGINYKDDKTAILVLHAPGRKFVNVIGDFNNWMADPLSGMKKTPDGNRFWIEITNLTPQKEYAFQYVVDGSLYIADPYTEKVLDWDDDQYIEKEVYPNLMAYPAAIMANRERHRNLSVLQTAQPAFAWKVTDFKSKRPAKMDIVAYELLIRDFTTQHSYKSVMDSLPYLKRLGVNVLQLMPVMEFEGNDSWGYNGSFYFAPDKYYGTKDDLKRLIDKAHEMGIAVVLDIVLNHAFGESPFSQLAMKDGRLAADNPWFNPVATHPFNVGNDFNHSLPATKELVKRVTQFWVKEYKIDGYRFDLSKGFTQVNSANPENIGLMGKYDQFRVDTWKRISDEIWSIDDKSFYVILEHFADGDEEKALSDYGMMLWGNLNHAYGNTLAGIPSGNSLSNGYFKNRGWTQPNLVSYMESHDEERIMVRALTEGERDGSYNARELATALERAKAAAAFFFLTPGPKMIWQFGELGYDVSINGFGGRLSRKPIRWEYYQDASRRKLYDTYATLINLKNNDAIKNAEVSMSQQTGGLIKQMTFKHASMNTYVVGNFGVMPMDIELEFPSTGTWYDYFTGDTMRVVKNMPIAFKPGEFHIFTSKPMAKPRTGLVPFAVPSKVLAVEDQVFGQQVKVYPNPSAGLFKVTVETKVSSPLEIQVTDMTGRTVRIMQAGAGARELSVDLSDQPSGVYLVEILNGNIKTTKRIVKQ